MTVGAVVLDLVGTVNSPGTQVTLTWSMSSDLVTVYTSNGEFQEPDTGVDLLTVQGISGGGGSGGGNTSGSPPNYGYGGFGGAYAVATFSPSALTYPVPVTVGQGGAASSDGGGATGDNGTDTLFGTSHPTDYYVWIQGAKSAQEIPTGVGYTTFSYELGGVQVGTDTASTINAGAAGGGAPANGNHALLYGAGTCTEGPGGDGGTQGEPGNPGFLYGGGGGGGEWNGTAQFGGADGANGFLTVDATYTAADYYNIYRQGTLLTTSTSLEFIDTNPIPGTITYEVISVISGFEQSQGAGYVTVDVPEPQPVAVPNLIGMTSEVASTTIENAGLLVGPSGFQVRATGPYFVVVAQGPAAGTIVPVNTYVGYVLAVPPDYGGIGYDGQYVTPTPNVTAPAGIYGDQWGANGGGSEPIGGGVIGQTGWSDSVKVTISDAQRRESYLIGAPNLSVGSQMSDTQLDGHTPDDTLPTGGSLI